MVRPRSVLVLILVVAAAAASAGSGGTSFQVSGGEFLLDGKPFQMMSGELHPQRIPREYWKTRLAQVRAMGLNTVSLYVFWNALESQQGVWDFTGSNDIAAFIREAQAAGLYVFLRPGPYACAEWDFGGLPAWLLRIPDIKVRCRDNRYMAAVRDYVRMLAANIRDLQISNGGPVLLLQIENEYGSYGNDREYLSQLASLWRSEGITVPFSTADGATPAMLEAGTLPGAAIGLDPGTEPKHFAEARKISNDVPVFCSELYPGWLTHWGEPWAKGDSAEFLRSLRWLVDNRKSFSLYVAHGGTNFGFTAGANYSDHYEPTMTSYDYDAPISESGELRPLYYAIRNLLAKHQDAELPAPPAVAPAIAVAPVRFEARALLFDSLPPPVRSAQPRPMEMLGQTSGFVLYATTLVGHRSGTLAVTDLHDYATVFVDGRYVGAMDRRLNQQSLEIPAATPPASRLEILVEAMGRINYGQRLVDRKGITDRVTLNGMTLMNWEMTPLPMGSSDLGRLSFRPGPAPARPSVFFRGTFDIPATGDTFLDLSGWEKGVVWVNGKNLGRYWKIGPQQRLFLPGAWLRIGRNEIIVFDLHRTEPADVRGFRTMNDEPAGGGR